MNNVDQVCKTCGGRCKVAVEQKDSMTEETKVVLVTCPACKGTGTGVDRNYRTKG